MRRLLLAGVFGLASLGLHAQGIDMSQGGPVDVTASDGIEWRQAEQVVIARGNARAGDVFHRINIKWNAVPLDGHDAADEAIASLQKITGKKRVNRSGFLIFGSEILAPDPLLLRIVVHAMNGAIRRVTPDETMRAFCEKCRVRKPGQQGFQGCTNLRRSGEG